VGGLILVLTEINWPSKSVTMWVRALYQENAQQTLLHKIDSQQSRLFKITIGDME
jgi:hypothetical protein